MNAKHNYPLIHPPARVVRPARQRSWEGVINLLLTTLLVVLIIYYGARHFISDSREPVNQVVYAFSTLLEQTRRIL